MISSLTAEREQLRSQLQEKTERVGNWKPSEDVLRSFWSDCVILSCSSSFRLQRHKLSSRVYRKKSNTTDRRTQICWSSLSRRTLK